jgi:hypothetical protein
VYSVPTVFVIGAGAGSDIDMPVGNALSELIANKLNIRFGDSSDLKHGDEAVVLAIREIARTRNGNANDWYAAGRAVASGIRYTRSIDSYINSHRDDDKIRDCAKLAIAQSILESEIHFQ